MRTDDTRSIWLPDVPDVPTPLAPEPLSRDCEPEADEDDPLVPAVLEPCASVPVIST